MSHHSLPSTQSAMLSRQAVLFHKNEGMRQALQARCKNPTQFTEYGFLNKIGMETVGKPHYRYCFLLMLKMKLGLCESLTGGDTPELGSPYPFPPPDHCSTFADVDERGLRCS